MKLLREHILIFRRVGLIILILVSLYNLLDQVLTLKMQSMLNDPQGFSNKLWFIAGFSILISIALPVLINFYLLYGLLQIQLKETNLSLFFKQNLAQLYIETLRSWGQSMLWGFLFIVPGLVRYFEYFFVPFVVTTMPAYQLGKIDALEVSRTLVKRRWLSLSLILTIFQFIIPLTFKSVFDDYYMFYKTPFHAFLLSATDAFFIIVSFQFIYRLFIKTLQEENHESLLSMARH